jgi:hypothetical protein
MGFLSLNRNRFLPPDDVLTLNLDVSSVSVCNGKTFPIPCFLFIPTFVFSRHFFLSLSLFSLSLSLFLSFLFSFYTLTSDGILVLQIPPRAPRSETVSLLLQLSASPSSRRRVFQNEAQSLLRSFAARGVARTPRRPSRNLAVNN